MRLSDIKLIDRHTKYDLIIPSSKKSKEEVFAKFSKTQINHFEKWESSPNVFKLSKIDLESAILCSFALENQRRFHEYNSSPNKKSYRSMLIAVIPKIFKQFKVNEKFNMTSDILDIKNGKYVCDRSHFIDIKLNKFKICKEGDEDLFLKIQEKFVSLIEDNKLMHEFIYGNSHVGIDLYFFSTKPDSSLVLNYLATH